MTIWNAHLVGTLKKYIKGAVDGYSRKSPIWGIMQSKGKFVANATGQKLTWNVRNKNIAATVYEDMQGRTFNRHNGLKQAELPWAAYDSTFAISKEDMLMNRGNEQMTNLLETNIDMATEGMQVKLCNAFYQDAGSSERELAGFQTWMGAGATLSNGFFNPSDTYAGLSTALGAYGGTAPTVAWPIGNTTTPEYDFWSPMILSATSTAYGSAATWQANCLDILRRARSLSGKNASNSSVDVVLMTHLWHDYFSAQLQVKEQIQVGTSAAAMVSLGFDAINYFGMALTPDYWCPDSKAFGINFNALELHSLQGEMVVSDPKVYSEVDKTDRYGMDFIGQMRQPTPKNDFIVGEYGA